MRTFNQTPAAPGQTGRAWNVEINVAAMIRVKDLAGVNLCDMTFADGSKVLDRLMDATVLGKVLWALLGPQAASQTPPMAQDGFYAILDGPTLGAAADAFNAELADFFLHAGLGGRLLTAMMDLLKKMEGRQKTTPPSEGGSPPSASDGPLASNPAATSATGTSSGNSPAPSASIPAP